MTTTHARMITDRQLGKLHAQFHALHVTSRDERLARIGRYIGRDIASTKELSQDEAGAVIDWLERGGD